MRQASFTVGRALPAILRQRHAVSKVDISRLLSRVIHFVPTFLHGSRFLCRFVPFSPRTAAGRTTLTTRTITFRGRPLASYSLSLRVLSYAISTYSISLPIHRPLLSPTSLPRDSDLHFDPQLMATASHRKKARSAFFQGHNTSLLMR
ncbi:hypothetical protein CTAM01_05826 [Colletotrichum tamarilloi]|uniref:Uncharacterized protein n=1 Tax=Colletotrichum tamarilloi TaxID=1209934 RepID=A0ABQ9RDN0_9PEZI|nr:uncharacterized protein CTAM01_05826 [Colletotrichum tamarilloi]KAK1501602.1 hypothetical protein CTAM01_05826 [Colletotrichum tamarilloi]